MFIVNLKDGLTIDRALKILKGKVAKTGMIKALRDRESYVKPSIKRREEIRKAIYIQKLKQEEMDNE